MGRLDELRARACGVGSPHASRSTARRIWPYDERGEPARLLLPALRQPDRRRGGGARSASSTAATALLFPSGTGATTALVLSLLEPGDTIALAARRLLRHGQARSRRSRSGACAYVEFDQTGPPPEGVQLVWLEAPSNPFLTMPDLEAAVAHPAPVVVDSTVATPIHLRPLEHGADFVAPQRDEVPRRPRRRRCSARSSAATRPRPRSCARSARRTGHRRPRPTRRGSCSAA